MPGRCKYGFQRPGGANTVACPGGYVDHQASPSRWVAAASSRTRRTAGTVGVLPTIAGMAVTWREGQHVARPVLRQMDAPGTEGARVTPTTAIGSVHQYLTSPPAQTKLTARSLNRSHPPGAGIEGIRASVPGVRARTGRRVALSSGCHSLRP